MMIMFFVAVIFLGESYPTRFLSIVGGSERTATSHSLQRDAGEVLWQVEGLHGCFHKWSLGALDLFLVRRIQILNDIGG